MGEVSDFSWFDAIASLDLTETYKDLLARSCRRRQNFEGPNLTGLLVQDAEIRERPSNIGTDAISHFAATLDDLQCTRQEL